MGFVRDYSHCFCLSQSCLCCVGISYSTDEFGLREAFSKYGEVVDAKVIVDRETGRSRGFAFVTFTSTEEASNAMQLDGQDLHGRRIRVNYATERGSGFGGRGFGGGNAGGYGAPAGGYGGGGAGGYAAPAGGYGGGSSYGGNASGGGYGGNSPYGGNAVGGGGDGYGSNFGGGYGVAGGVGGSDNFAQGSASNAGFDEKFSSNEPLGNDTDHQLESGLARDEQFGGSDNQFGDSENGQTEVGTDGFDQTDEGDVAKRA